MKKTTKMLCTLCPNGCEIKVEHKHKNILFIEGATCSNGKEFATNEIISPVRILTSSVKVVNGEIPLVSVKTNKPIPKSKIYEAMKYIKKINVRAPIFLNQVIIKNFLGLDVDLVATKSIIKV